MKLLKISWIVLCLAGLVYQTVLISNQYFSYATSSEVTVTNNHYGSSPAITVCFHIASIIKAGIYHQLAQKFNIPSCNITQMDFKLANKCIQKLWNFLNQKDWFKYTNPLIFQLSRPSRVLNSTSYLDNKLKCASINIQPRRLFFISGVIELKKLENIFSLAIHDRKDPIYNRSNHNLIFFKREFLKIGYTVYETIRPSTLTYPCIDYAKQRFFRTRDHCIQQCKKIIERKECLKRGSSKESCSFEVINKNYNFHGESDYSPRMYPGIKNCNECPLECDTYMFQPTREQLQTFKDKIDLMVLLGPSNRIIRIKFSVKLSILEFIIYIASCFGLWFGLSVFQCLEELSIKIKKAFDDFKLKKSNQTNLIFIQTNQLHQNNPLQHHNNLSLNLINGPLIAKHPIQT